MDQPHRFYPLEPNWRGPCIPGELTLFIIVIPILAHTSAFSHPIITATLGAWTDFLKTGCSNFSTIPIHIPLTALHFILRKLSFEHWYKKGIQNISYVVKGNKLTPFQDLTMKFSIPQSDFLLYARLAACLCKYSLTDLTIPESVWSFMTTKPPWKKGKALFYNLLQSKSTFVKTPPLLKWEEDTVYTAP